MIVFLTLCYVALLALLIKLKVLPSNPLVWLSTLGWMVVLLIVLFIPLQWGAPAGPVRFLTQTVQIVPNVAGEVVEVPVKANEPLAAGDILFVIDPTPFAATLAQRQASLRRIEAQLEQDVENRAAAEAQLKGAEAQQELAATKLENDRKLVASGTVSQIQVDTSERNFRSAVAAVDQARAALASANVEIGALMADGTPAKLAEAQAAVDLATWEVQQTTVRAPGNGFATYVALGVGQRVTTLPLQPAMGFIDVSQERLVVEINQIHLRHVQPGQTVEIAFKTMPGHVVSAAVERVVGVNASGQATISGTLPAAGNTQAEPFYVVVTLDEEIDDLRPGTVGTAAIYTDEAPATHIVRKVMIRMEAIMNYVVAPL